MNVHYFTTPSGEEMAVLPRAELDALTEAVEHTRAVADYRAGKVTGLSARETRELVAAASPLAFWRKRRGLTQAAAAAEAGIAQNYFSDIENGKRTGPIELWLKLSRALDVRVEDLVDTD
ncbi:MAG TPA: helix-turn-helix transcriptional regulator [Rhizobiaceae bacterium]|nr:helix-turn-helix transcriptional regulator [Rhizobiaceae bacterium]